MHLARLEQQTHALGETPIRRGSRTSKIIVRLSISAISTRTNPPPTLVEAEIRHPLDSDRKNGKVQPPYPHGTLSSPNYPQNYSDNTVRDTLAESGRSIFCVQICRWHFYRRHAVIRLFIHHFHTERDYDTLTFYLGQNLNNHAMILYKWSGNETIDQRVFVPNDNLLLVFNADRSNNASGFSLDYEIIERGCCRRVCVYRHSVMTRIFCFV